MGRNERRRHRYITDIACLTALNYIVSKNSLQPIANPSNHSPESKAHLKRFALSFEVFGMQSQPLRKWGSWRGTRQITPFLGKTKSQKSNRAGAQSLQSRQSI
jgi:hypothetical protein